MLVGNYAVCMSNAVCMINAAADALPWYLLSHGFALNLDVWRPLVSLFRQFTPVWFSSPPRMPSLPATPFLPFLAPPPHLRGSRQASITLPCFLQLWSWLQSICPRSLPIRRATPCCGTFWWLFLHIFSVGGKILLSRCRWNRCHCWTGCYISTTNSAKACRPWLAITTPWFCMIPINGRTFGTLLRCIWLIVTSWRVLMTCGTRVPSPRTHRCILHCKMCLLLLAPPSWRIVIFQATPCEWGVVLLSLA